MHLGGLLSTQEVRVALGYRLLGLLRFFLARLQVVPLSVISTRVTQKKTQRKKVAAQANCNY